MVELREAAVALFAVLFVLVFVAGAGFGLYTVLGGFLSDAGPGSGPGTGSNTVEENSSDRSETVSSSGSQSSVRKVSSFSSDVRGLSGSSEGFGDDGSLKLGSSSSGSELKLWVVENRTQAGESFSFYYRTKYSESGAHNFWFGVQDSENYYDIDFKPWKGTFQLGEVIAGEEKVLEKASFDYRGQKWYMVKVDWREDGKITVSLSEPGGQQLAEVSGTSTAHRAGGIGLRTNNNADYVAWFDGIRRIGES